MNDIDLCAEERSRADAYERMYLNLLNHEQELMQQQMNLVSDYLEIFDWISRQPWFDKQAFDVWFESRVGLPVDNSGDN